ncbi:WXG100 family type VII secretion target, partial [Actinoalloteichus spitiensis]|uniref:WXG100 family type VII secretion target n=1 Tax=Actinoalloteichus spitiensis TaxID=252394 RepID=UPI00037BCD30
MSHDGYQVDPELLADRASVLGAEAATAERILNRLREVLDATGACWGDDEIGRRFAAGHVEPADTTLELLDALPGRLTDHTGRLHAAAATYREAEETNTSV